MSLNNTHLGTEGLKLLLARCRRLFFIGNLDKLRQRFPNGFDVGASVNRKEGDL